MNRSPATRQRRRNLYDASAGCWPVARKACDAQTTVTAGTKQESGAAK